MNEPITHAFTIDVEDWFHILDCPQMPQPADYSRFESRVAHNTSRVLDLLASHEVKATFFVLGWVAEAHPSVVRQIAAAGHEIAIHGFAHVLASSLTDAELEADTRRAYAVVADVSGMAPVGYRSPGGSLLARQRWILDLQLDLGLKFDSSIYPRPGGLAEAEGYPTTPYPIHRRGEQVLWEYPSTIRQWLGLKWAFAEGGFLRLLPLVKVKTFFAERESAGHSVNLCIHPREFDPDQPRLPLGMMKQWKTQVGIGGFECKVRTLLSEYRFGPMGRVLQAAAERHRNVLSEPADILSP